MGVSGVPLNYKKSDIVHALTKAGGRIRHAAQYLECSPHSVYRIINADPELLDLLNSLRYDTDERLLDKAEDKLESILDQIEDVNSGLRASMFVLNTKGAKRGYLPAEVAAAQEEAKAVSSLGLSLEEMQEFAEWRAAKKASQNGSQADLKQPLADSHISQSNDQSRTS